MRIGNFSVSLAVTDIAVDDVRDIQRTLKSRGLTRAMEADEPTSGPARLMVLDPDGNPILIDQRVPGPKT